MDSTRSASKSSRSQKDTSSSSGGPTSSSSGGSSRNQGDSGRKASSSHGVRRSGSGIANVLSGGKKSRTGADGNFVQLRSDCESSSERKPRSKDQTRGFSSSRRSSRRPSESRKSKITSRKKRRGCGACCCLFELVVLLLIALAIYNRKWLCGNENAEFSFFGLAGGEVLFQSEPEPSEWQKLSNWFQGGYKESYNKSLENHPATVPYAPAAYGAEPQCAAPPAQQ